MLTLRKQACFMPTSSRVSAAIEQDYTMPTNPEIFVTLDQPISEDIVKRLASDLSEALGRDRLQDYDGRGVLVLERESDHHLLPEQLPSAESVLSVRLCTPYYGQGYERGFWPEIAATLEFLRHRLPAARVWYGPDGTDQVEQVSSEFLDRLWDYWSRYGGRPYYEKWRQAQPCAGPNGGPTTQLDKSGVTEGPPSVS
jgi:hypothetical protein